MTKHLLSAVLYSLFLNGFLAAQIQSPVHPMAIAAAGQTLSDITNDVRLSFTVGETVVATFQKPGSNINLGQGFHRFTDTIVVAVDDPVFAARQLKIYPNPASDALFVEFEAVPPSSGFLMASVFDWLGRLVLPARQLDGFSENRLLLDGLASGPYLLRLTDGAGRAVAVPFVSSH